MRNARQVSLSHCSLNDNRLNGQAEYTVGENGLKPSVTSRCIVNCAVRSRKKFQSLTRVRDIFIKMDHQNQPRKLLSLDSKINIFFLLRKI